MLGRRHPYLPSACCQAIHLPDLSLVTSSGELSTPAAPFFAPPPHTKFEFAFDYVMSVLLSAFVRVETILGFSPYYSLRA